MARTHLPPRDEIVALIKSVRSDIDDEYRAFEDDEEPGIQLTVGWSDKGSVDSPSWSYQTGDKSFSGGAYGFPHWGVVGVYRDSNVDDVADEILQQLADLAGEDYEPVLEST